MSFEYTERERVPDGLKQKDVLNEDREAAEDDVRLASIRSWKPLRLLDTEFPPPVQAMLIPGTERVGVGMHSPKDTGESIQLPDVSGTISCKPQSAPSCVATHPSLSMKRRAHIVNVNMYSSRRIKVKMADWKVSNQPQI